MTAYEQAYIQYQEACKNDFFDAWGIAINPKTLYELRAECLSQLVAYSTGDGMLEKLFGLVIIPCRDCAEDKMYVVDEFLGRQLQELYGERRSDER